MSKRQIAGAIVVAPGEGRFVGNVEFVAESEDTPRFNAAVITKAPHTEGPEPHVHRSEDDAFYVLGGEFAFLLGEETLIAGPGTFVLVPPGVRHTFANRSDRPARMLNVHAPAGFDLRLR